MWVLIDNYDSFSYMLYDYLLRIHEDVRIVKSDEITLEELITLNPERLIISPGPKTPNEALFSSVFVDYFMGRIPILGVCLGHQILGLKLGSCVTKATIPKHGKLSSVVKQNAHVLLSGIPTNIQVMRYHSLIVTEWENNQAIQALLCAEEDGILLMFVNENLNLVGFQFHPESISTDQGLLFLTNWDSWLNSKYL